MGIFKKCCQCCCVRRIEIGFAKEDDVDGEDPKVPVGNFGWDVETQPESSFTSEDVGYGLILPVCTRIYQAPVSEIICVGTAKEQGINGMFRTLDRVFPSVSGRYNPGSPYDFSGSWAVRCNVFIYGMTVTVQRASGWTRILVNAYGFEEYFFYGTAGSTSRAYDTSTCLGTGPVFVFGTPPESMYCSNVFESVCPGVNNSLLAIHGSYFTTYLPNLDTGWFAADSCPNGEYISDEYAMFEYAGVNPGLDNCRLPYDITYVPASFPPCNFGYSVETRRPLADSYTLRRNRVKLFPCLDP